MAMRPVIAARRPMWAPVGEPGPRRGTDISGETRPRAHIWGARSAGTSLPLWATPAPGRCTLRRVTRAAQHRRIRDVERRTTRGERHDVIDGEVRRSMGGTLVARAPVAVLTTPGAKDAGAESLPGARAVQGVVAAAIGLPGVLGAAATSAAGDDTTNRAQLHPRIVDGLAGAVYSLVVLRLETIHDQRQQGRSSGTGHAPGAGTPDLRLPKRRRRGAFQSSVAARSGGAPGAPPNGRGVGWDGVRWLRGGATCRRSPWHMTRAGAARFGAAAASDQFCGTPRSRLSLPSG